MELLLYRSYLKYLKDTRVPMSKAFKKMPKTMVALLIILLLSAISVIVVICIEKIHIYFYAAIAIEVIIAFVVFYTVSIMKLKIVTKILKNMKPIVAICMCG